MTVKVTDKGGIGKLEYSRQTYLNPSLLLVSKGQMITNVLNFYVNQSETFNKLFRFYQLSSSKKKFYNNPVIMFLSTDFNRRLAKSAIQNIFGAFVHTVLLATLKLCE